MIPKTEYFFTQQEPKGILCQIEYYESGDHYIGVFSKVFPLAKRIRPQKTFYFKYDEQ